MGHGTRRIGSQRLALIAIVAAGCAGPTGPSDQVDTHLPDLVPAPSVEFSTSHEDDGTVLLRFSSVLVNVGNGDFLLVATRQTGAWTVFQEVGERATEAERHEIEATLVWGGDGHDHWHVARVAEYWVVALDEEGNPVDEDRSLADTKVGFCFFDHERELDYGPEEPVFSVHDCGHEDDLEIQMGMSPGWGDKYAWNLPGQQIEITRLDDGTYRLWAEADPDGAFVDATRDNNITWVDFELATIEGGRRGARALGTGPTPEDHRS